MSTGPRSGQLTRPDLAPVDDVAREPLWYAFGLGQDRSAPDPPVDGRADRPDAAASGRLPAHARPLLARPLPARTVDLLEAAPYPHGRPAGAGDADVRLGHALQTAFGVQRREPWNPFNDHRGYPSVRSKFPVQTFVEAGGCRYVLDVYRHALVELAAGVGDPRVRQVVLAGQYTRLQTFYRWFRGSLVGLEVGVNLRALCSALELFGIPGRLRLPDATATAHLSRLGLVPTWEWTLPVSVELGPWPADGSKPPAGGSQQRDGGEAPSWTGERPPDVTDPILADVVAMNRAQNHGGPAVAIGAAIPSEVSDRALSWAELLWRRSSGGMPRGMHGTNGYRRQLPTEALLDAVAWASVPLPGSLLPDVFRAITTTVVVQGTDGFADGIYQVVDGTLRLAAAGPGAAARLEKHYGYSLLPWRGCDVRHASALWFFSMRPREVLTRFGAGGWSAAQYAGGWAAQGVSLAAAAHGLYARPVRAFQESSTRQVLGRPDDEMMLLAMIVGTPRPRPPALDLRL